MAHGDPIIDDPLDRFLKEEEAREQARDAGVKDAVTGVRTPVNKAEKQKLRGEEIKRRKAVTKHVLSILLNEDIGREWLYEQLIRCNVFGTPFAGDDRSTAYNAGALYYGKILESDIKKIDIRQYFRMLQEGWERETMWDDSITDK